MFKERITTRRFRSDLGMWEEGVEEYNRHDPRDVTGTFIVYSYWKNGELIKIKREQILPGKNKWVGPEYVKLTIPIKEDRVFNFNKGIGYVDTDDIERCLDIEFKITYDRNEDKDRTFKWANSFTQHEMNQDAIYERLRQFQKLSKEDLDKYYKTFGV